MRRCNHVFEAIIAADNLLGAWRKFHSGKSSRPLVRAFTFDVLRRLARLRIELEGGAYAPAPYRLFFIHEPKRRLISAAAVRDRVVHHALHRVVAPWLDRSLVPHCYACLPKRGAHRALLALQRAMRTHRHVLLLDVRAYFPSIDPTIMLGLLERRIKDPRALDLCARILTAGRGLYDPPALREFLGLDLDWPPLGVGVPIGNLTSQWWGNHYLGALDHLLRRELHLPHSQRYMDDIALFADDRSQLVDAREHVAAWLLRERHLRLKNPRREPRATTQPVTYLGRRVSRAAITPTREAFARMRVRVGDALRDPDPRRIERTLASYRGVLGLGDTFVDASDKE